MADADTVETEVEEATVFGEALALARKVNEKFAEQRPGEPDKTFFMRLTETIAETSEEVFDAAPEAVRDWFNEAAAAINAKQDVIAPEGFTSVADQAPVETKTKKATVAKEPKAPKAPPPPKEPKAKAVSTLIRELVLANPKGTVEDITNALAEMGHKDVKTISIATIRYDTIATLKVVQAAGKLSGVDL